MPQTTKRKILFIIPRFGSINRGVESFAKELIDRLDKEKFEITVLSEPLLYKSTAFESWPCKIVKRERFDVVDNFPDIVRRVFGVFNLRGAADWEALSLYILSKKLSKNGSFDIAIPLGGYWTYKLARKLSKKVVSIGQSGAVKSWLNLSDYFVALTSVDLLNGRQLAPNVPSEVIPNGVDTSKFKVGIEENKIKKVLCVAAFVEDKRHVKLFDALIHVKSDFELICTGSGILETHLKRHPITQKKMVTFKSLPFEQLPQIYEVADVFTLPSLHEAFGIVFIEAMAAGLPIVAHDGTRQHEVLGDHGIFCNTDDKIAYAAALDKALTIPKKQEMRDIVIDRFSWDKVVKSYTILFEHILN